MIRELWAKFRRGKPDDLREEIEAHLAFAREDNEARGMDAEKARRAAALQLGNQTLLEEAARETWSFPRLETLWKDLQYGWRNFHRAPGLACAILATLALGIGMNTAIFSTVYAVLLRPLPYPASDTLVWIGESVGKGEGGISVTWVNFEHWRAENHSFEKMAAFRTADLTLTGHGPAELTHAGVITSGFLELLGAHPLLGRVFSKNDEKPGATPVVVLNYEFWNRVLHADPNVLGSVLDLNGTPYQIIGVLAPGPKFLNKPLIFMCRLDLPRTAPTAGATVRFGCWPGSSPA